jgi:arginyl-tRNA synthetase
MSFKINSKIEDKFTSIVVKEIFESLKNSLDKEDLEKMEVGYPPNKIEGDFSLPCFSLIKKLKNNPTEIAKQLSQEIRIKDNGVISSVKSAGPYLNFFVNKDRQAEIILTSILNKNSISSGLERVKERVMIEYVSPNTNKPLHLGHGRNAFLGSALSNILEENNYRVVKTCLVNDRGVHISKSMLAYDKLGQKTTPEKEGIKGDHFVGEYYVKFDELKKEDPEVENIVHEMLKKWEDGDRKINTLWKKMNRWVMDGMKQTLKKIGVSFDKFYFESDMYKEGKDIVLQALHEGKFVKKDGAVVADLSDYRLPDKVLLRSDGTSLYITQDIYLTYLKYKDFEPKKIIHVIGSEQDLVQRQLFAIMDILGFEESKNLYHLSYGMVNVEGGKLKSREGVKVDLDTLIGRLENMAREEIENRNNSLKEKELKKRSEIIALGALKYYILQYGPKTIVNFDPKESLSFAGKTGPYLQYSYARIKSIIKKSGVKISDKVDFSKLNNNEEEELITNLGKFKEVLKESGERYDPSILAKYLYEVAKSFHGFYHTSPVIDADNETKKARLLLISSTAEIIKKGLNILGIEVLEEM